MLHFLKNGRKPVRFLASCATPLLWALIAGGFLAFTSIIIADEQSDVTAEIVSQNSDSGAKNSLPLTAGPTQGDWRQLKDVPVLPERDRPSRVTGVRVPPADLRITNSNMPQNETSIAPDPNDPLIVVGGFNDYSLLTTGRGGNGVCYSSDGGNTFTHHATGVALPAGFTNSGGDPGIAWNSQRQVYYGHIAGAAGGNYSSSNGVFVSRSDDNGVTWNPTVAVASNTSSGALVNFEDKPLIASDHYPASSNTDNVYMSWTRFYGGNYPSSSTTGGGDIMFSRSTNSGVTWSASPIRLSNPTSLSTNGGTGSQGASYVQQSEPEVGPDGRIYVVYWHGGTTVVQRSDDGGLTWGAPTYPFGSAFSVSQIQSPLSPLTFRVNTSPNIETNPTQPGHVYVVSTDARGGDSAQIIFARSTNFGATWETTIIVNDDGTGNLQVFPWMAVSPSGDIKVIWYDTRNSATNNLLDVYGVCSNDNGATFLPNFRITDQLFQPNTGQFAGNTFFGDYNGLGASQTGFHALWTDGRDGEQEIYYDRVDCGGACDLFIRDCPLDDGSVPSSATCPNGWIWLSPDIWLTDLFNKPIANPVLGAPNHLWARVWNIGGATCNNITVDFFWADYGIGGPWHPVATVFIGSLPESNHDSVFVNWTPSTAAGLTTHRCILVRASCAGDPCTVMDTDWENNIGWKNFTALPGIISPAALSSTPAGFKVTNNDEEETQDVFLNLALQGWPQPWGFELTSPDDLLQLGPNDWVFEDMAPLQVNDVTLTVIEPTGTHCDTGTVHVTGWIDGESIGGITTQVTAPVCPMIVIEKTHDVIQGQYHYVSITTEGTNVEMGGFDFLIAYDASALTFMEATPGQLLEDCGWEYFTYRYGADGNCGDACPSGLLRIMAIAETNNGPNHPACYGPPDCDPHELVRMKFLVTNDRTFECMYVPIRFFWGDCGDNTVSSVDGELLYVSDHVYEFEGTEITDPTFGFPTYTGVQTECLENDDPLKPDPIRCPIFVNGGVDIVCADSIDDRGDINLNGVVNEVADAVLYSNYFVHGISVFNVNIDGQIAASDVNADGITLSVADLVYLIRIITGDAPPYPKLTPVAANAELVNGVLSVDADMGAAYVVVERSITPQLLAESMEMKYQYDANHDLTRILVYSMDKDRRFAGDFLGGIDGNVITLEMATYEGAPVTTKLVPDEFALYPSYPNPFNPVTTISFALASLVDYELVIYNALGQTVETFSGHSGPGLERIDWNASGFASGVYFYRLTAGDFTDTKKMVLLK